MTTAATKPQATKPASTSVWAAGWNIVKNVLKFAGKVILGLLSALRRPEPPLTADMKTHLLDQWEAAYRNKKAEHYDWHRNGQYRSDFNANVLRLEREMRELQFKIEDLRRQQVVYPINRDGMAS